MTKIVRTHVPQKVGMDKVLLEDEKMNISKKGYQRSKERFCTKWAFGTARKSPERGTPEGTPPRTGLFRAVPNAHCVQNFP